MRKNAKGGGGGGGGGGSWGPPPKWLWEGGQLNELNYRPPIGSMENLPRSVVTGGFPKLVAVVALKTVPWVGDNHLQNAPLFHF